MADLMIKIIPNGPYRVMRADQDRRRRGRRRTRRRRGQGRFALPLRQVREQTVLRRHARTHRFRVDGVVRPADLAAACSKSLAFLLTIAAAEPGAVAPSVTADLDGDGVSETVTAVPAPGSVRLQVRDAGGRRLAEAKAPAPSADVVPVALTAAPIGSAGALLEVDAATDTSACLSVWR